MIKSYQVSSSMGNHCGELFLSIALAPLLSSISCRSHLQGCYCLKTCAAVTPLLVFSATIISIAAITILFPLLHVEYIPDHWNQNHVLTTICTKDEI